ncbi:MAG: hypothetical protein AMK73_05580 [Planctomycetes bacterium SM23_32]|nr:MAG: hypothetical protein AMK73_05580 [Planctomycetes bacterium SM23_32]
MLTPKLAERFSAWKARQPRGGSARPHRSTTDREARQYLAHRDPLSSIAAVPCELRLTWASGIALEALLRWGRHEDPRAVRAINTLLAMSGGHGWCGCGYFDTRARNYVEDCGEPVDLSRFPVWSANREHGLDWFAGPDDVARFVCDGERRSAISVGRGGALLVRHYYSTGECAMVVRRALTFHPTFPGSTEEVNTALACTWYQSEDGTWGESCLSTMFCILARVTCPLAAFLVLRSVPLLIREQQADGLWQESAVGNSVSPPRGASSLIILRTLKKMGFLDALVPQ